MVTGDCKELRVVIGCNGGLTVGFGWSRVVMDGNGWLRGGQYLCTTRESVEHYLSATLAILGKFLGNTWATLEHYLGDSLENI